MHHTIQSLFVIVLLVQHIEEIDAHARWVCPPPRNPDTGIKTGPCGLETNQFVSTTTSFAPITVQPGPLLVQWEESIFHTGAPFRIALSHDGTDTGQEPCVLLDHIPHFDTPATFPTFGTDSTYTLYTLTIDIPDVQCNQCSLHLANPMTDKIGLDGTPDGIGCTDPSGTCFSVYHSCTIPLSINGTQPRSQYNCPNTNPTNWPTTWIGDGGQSVDATVMGVYRRESAIWEQSFLMDVPESYRTIVTDNNQLSCTKSDLFPTQVVTTSSPLTPPRSSPVTTATSPIAAPTASPISTSLPIGTPSSSPTATTTAILSSSSSPTATASSSSPTAATSSSPNTTPSSSPTATTSSTPIETSTLSPITAPTSSSPIATPTRPTIGPTTPFTITSDGSQINNSFIYRMIQICFYAIYIL